MDSLQNDYERFRSLVKERVNYWLTQNPPQENWITTSFSFRPVFEVWFRDPVERKYMLHQLENSLETAILGVFNPERSYCENFNSPEPSGIQMHDDDPAVQFGKQIYDAFQKKPSRERVEYLLACDRDFLEELEDRDATP